MSMEPAPRASRPATPPRPALEPANDAHGGANEPHAGEPHRDEAPSDEVADLGETAEPPQTDAFAHARPSDFGSLLADLSREEENPRLRVHDRTHLEVSVDYDLAMNRDPRTGKLDKAEAEQTFHWEAYFFAPESLRIDSRTYGKQDVYEDLQSYVRFAVPDVPYDALVGEPLERVAQALESGTHDEATHEMRLFVCQVRAAGVAARRVILAGLGGPALERSRALAQAETMVVDTRALVARTRAVLAAHAQAPEPVGTAVAWIEEDFSRLLETMLGDLAMGLRRGAAPEAVVLEVERVAVDEARHRDRTGLGGVGRVGMSRRQLEALEFRRHVLKRFTSSVLWLKPQVRPASEWVLHLLYAVAASVAMGFATMAALWNGADMTANYGRWVLVAIVAYAAKDRMKAFLQTVFANVVSRHFPDRSWRVFDPEKKVELGAMEEQAGFVGWNDLPQDVLDVRRSTRRHDLEERARPETVLFHRKEVSLHRDRILTVDPRFDALTEILRLDLRRWLAHTDDPKREFVFADPGAGIVGSATAPRVYNIGVVYRLRRAGKDTPWHRARVVVTRKGIRRIDPVQ